MKRHAKHLGHPTWAMVRIAVPICLSVVVGLACLSSPAAADTCPNEAIREQQGAQELPDCRAYEMVSPLDKNGGDIDRNFAGKTATSAAAPSGDAVAYVSAAQFAGIGSGAPYGQYLSSRGASGWETYGITPPLDADPNQSGPLGAFVLALSRDLSSAVVRTNAELTPRATSLLGGSWGLYLQRNVSPTRSYELLSLPFAPLPTDPIVTFNFRRFDLVAATPDLRHVVFNSSRQLTPDGPPSSPFTPDAVYEWANGHVQLVSVLPGGALPESATGGSSVPVDNGTIYPGDHVISDDGGRVYFSVRSGQVGLYVREGGVKTAAVSASERAGADPALGLGAEFVAAKASDGSIAFFEAGVPLTENSPEIGTDVGLSLYRWDANAPVGSRLENLTTADPEGKPRMVGVAGVNEAATAVYFVARGVLAPGGVAGALNLYVWSEAEGLAHVATLDAADTAVWSRNRVSTEYRAARIGANGQQLLFVSHAQLTAYPTNGFAQVYLYDRAADEIVCVSCGDVQASSAADAGIFRFDEHPLAVGVSPDVLPVNLTPDGRRVLFETADRLLSQDVNGQIDVYVWDRGALSLISTGRGNDPSRFVAASENGNDVFFTSRQRLVPSDTDNQTDLYDARVGGGFPAAMLATDCAGEGCQSASAPSPVAPGPGSAAVRGIGNVSRPVPRRCKKGQMRRNKRCVARHRKHKQSRAHHKAKNRKRPAGAKQGVGR